MAQANTVEFLMLDLINEERTSRGLNPLEINDALNQSSEDHSQWMLETNTFSHTGEGGSTARVRIEDADYALEGSWGTAENIGWQSERGAAGIADDVADIHASLMDSPGHRANILNPDLVDIGIGIERGDFTSDQGLFDGVMITQNFGRTEAVSAVPQQEYAPVPAPYVPVVDTIVVPDLVMSEVTAPIEDTPPVEAPVDLSDVFDFIDAPVRDDTQSMDDVIVPVTFTETVDMPAQTNFIYDRSTLEEFLEDIFAEFNGFFCGGFDFA